MWGRLFWLSVHRKRKGLHGEKEQRSALRGHLQVRRRYGHSAHNAPGWPHLSADCTRVHSLWLPLKKNTKIKVENVVPPEVNWSTNIFLHKCKKWQRSSLWPHVTCHSHTLTHSQQIKVSFSFHVIDLSSPLLPFLWTQVVGAVKISQSGILGVLFRDVVIDIWTTGTPQSLINIILALLM